MNIDKQSILDQWNEYTLTNDNGMTVRALDFGGIITKIVVPDRTGKLENVVLGYKDYAEYAHNPNYFGALVGHVAGRIQNAAFELDGRTYSLETNDGANHLHGGSNGFHQVIWKVEPFQTVDAVGLKLTHQSADGDSGYPGNVAIAVTYTLTNSNEFSIDYWANTDKTTPLTMTNHSYFNLSGDLKTTVHDHEVTMDSDSFVELDENLIPTGEKLHVSGTTFDFRSPRKLGEGLEQDAVQHKVASNGYDHYFLFNNKKTENVIAKDGASGRTLTITTNQPGVVMYTGNGLDESIELGESQSGKYLGVCFETQASPASLHHEGFPSVVLETETTYNKRTVFSFGVES